MAALACNSSWTIGHRPVYKPKSSARLAFTETETQKVFLPMICVGIDI
jgi:hypothetical protein